jgi:hypothetical protein
MLRSKKILQMSVVQTTEPWVVTQFLHVGLLSELIEGQYISFKNELLYGSGLSAPLSGDFVILFMRRSCLELINFILKFHDEREEMILGYISGQPGSGKSILTYLSAMCLNSTTDFIWIHFASASPSFFRKCNVVVANESGREAHTVEYTELLGAFAQWVGEFKRSYRLIILDGIVEGEDFQEILELSGNWFRYGDGDRRLLYVSSMGSRIVQGADRSTFAYEMHSWTEEEFQMSVRDSRFLEAVDPMLDATARTADIHDRVTAKTYYVGGCAHYMFQRTTQEVKDEIKDILDHSSNLEYIFSVSVGNRSTDLIHRLFNIYGGETPRTILSEYVMIQIGNRLGPDKIQMIADTFVSDNPGANGSMLEKHFFASAATGSIQLINKNGETLNWFSNRGISLLDPVHPTADMVPIDTWLKPKSWKIAAYDAVYLRRKNVKGKSLNTICFVQVTRRKQHALNLYPMKELIDILRKKGLFETQKVEIMFVTARNTLSHCKVGKIHNEDALRRYGWRKDCRNKIKIWASNFRASP